MTNTAIIIAFQKDFDRSSKPDGPSGNVQVKANAILLINEKIVDRFNIPKPTAAIGGGGVTEIAPFSYTRFSDLDDTTGQLISVPGYEKSAPVSKGGITVRFGTGLFATATRRERTCSIKFPGFFTIPMISQALGSMLKTREPNSWSLDRTGKSYPFVPNASTDVFAGRKNGAWCVTAPIAAVNADDSDKVGSETTVKSKSKRSSNTDPDAGN